MSGNGNGHHWSKFTWRDWQNDVALRACSLGARGFWIECLAAMHEGNPIGHLTFNGKPATIKQMAVNANCSEKETRRFLDELEEAGVFSRSENGTIFSRRMVRDAQDAETSRNNGKKGGNPKLQGVNPPFNPHVNGGDKAKSLESESERKIPPVAPHAVGGARRANGTNPRAEGSNPRGPSDPQQKIRCGFVETLLNDMKAKRNGHASAPSLIFGEIGHAPH